MTVFYDTGGIQVRDARPDDIKSMANNMRAYEKYESMAYSKKTAEEILEMVYGQSIKTLCVESDHQIVAMAGLIPETLLSDRAMAWVMTTPLIEKIGYRFAKASLKLKKIFSGGYKVLYGAVDIHHQFSLRWLKWLGASLSEPQGGEIKFHYFELENK